MLQPIDGDSCVECCPDITTLVDWVYKTIYSLTVLSACGISNSSKMSDSVNCNVTVTMTQTCLWFHVYVFFCGVGREEGGGGRVHAWK